MQFWKKWPKVRTYPKDCIDASFVHIGQEMTELQRFQCEKCLGRNSGFHTYWFERTSVPETHSNKLQWGFNVLVFQQIHILKSKSHVPIIMRMCSTISLLEQMASVSRTEMLHDELYHLFHTLSILNTIFFKKYFL